jgi:cell division protein FtsQ
MHQSIGKKNKIIIYIIFLFVLSTTSEKISVQQKKYSLKIDKIEVIGLSNSKNLEIQNDLSSIFYQNIFLIDSEEINKIINKYNIIEEYNIKKIYPSTLNIEIKSTKFLAKIVDGDQLFVGSNGKLISNEISDKVLPYMFGKFNSKEFLKFKENIKHSKFDFGDFKTVYFFPSNRWDVLTNDNILIKLPQKNIIELLNMGYEIIASTKFKNKNVIDLRMKNHLIVN